jgi:hypothetical protein
VEGFPKQMNKYKSKCNIDLECIQKDSMTSSMLQKGSILEVI